MPHVGVIVSPKNARSRTSRRGRRLGCFGFKKVRLFRPGTGLCRQPLQGLLDVCRRSPATGDVAIRRADLVCGQVRTARLEGNDEAAALAELAFHPYEA